MASRKDQKNQARAARVAREQELAAKALRSRRLGIFAGLILAAVIVIVVVIAVSSGGSNTGGLLHGQQATTLIDSVGSELGGIPESGTTLGDPNAKVTMTYYGDLQCPVCAAFTTGADGGGLPQFIANEVKTGKVKIDYRSFCTATCNPADKTGGTSVFNTQQSAAMAAGKQNLFWYYAELFYHQQGAEDSGYVNSAFINGIAAQVPKLNTASWQSDRTDATFVTQIDADDTAATRAGVTGTPTVFMTGPKGTVNVGSGVLTYSQLSASVKAVS